MLGSRAVGHYTAANAFADAFAYARRALGLPATVVDWGLWKSWSDAQPQMKAAGLEPMPNDVAIRMLPAVLEPRRRRAVRDRRCRLGPAGGRLPDAGVGEGARPPGRRLPATTRRSRLVCPHPRGARVLGEPVAGTAHHRLWRARVLPGERSYPVAHRVRGVEVVPGFGAPADTFGSAPAGWTAPLSVTSGSSTRSWPTRPRPFTWSRQDDPAGATLTVWSSAGPDMPGATLDPACQRDSWSPPPAACPQGDQTAGAQRFDGAAISEMQRAWGVEGQPFQWTVTDCTSHPGGRAGRGRVTRVGGVARRGARRCRGARRPARRRRQCTAAAARGAESLSVADGGSRAQGLQGLQGTVEVYRRDGTGDALVVDVLVTGPDGTRWVDIRGLTYSPVESAPAPAADETAAAPAEFVDWSAMSRKDTVAELRTRLRAILARELGMPDGAVDFDMPFPELGLDSMMAMNLLRDAKALVRVDLSATMLWNHPSIVADVRLRRRPAGAEQRGDGAADDAAGSVDDAEDDAEGDSDSFGRARRAVRQHRIFFRRIGERR